MKVKRLVWILLCCALLAFTAKEYLTRQWRGGERFTVLRIDTLGGEVSSLDTETGLGTRIFLPPNLEINTGEGRGIWKAGVLAEMGKKYGIDWLKISIRESMGVRVTAVSLGMNKRWLGNWWDSGMWWWFSRKAEWQNMALDKMKGVERSLQVDGVETLRLGEEWRLGLGDRLAYSVIMREALSLRVVNTTGVAGLGAHMAGNLEISGFKVDLVENREPETDDCVLIAKSEDLNSISGRWITSGYDCKKQADENRESKQMELVLGKKYRIMLNGGT